MLDAVGFRLAALCAALASFVGGVVLAIHHPWNVAAVAVFALWSAVAFAWPRVWLFVLPAVLPAASLAPWTGWILFDEFDLVVLGAAAAGLLNLVRDDSQRKALVQAQWRLRLPLLVVGAASLAVARGLAFANDQPLSWYDDYTSPLNAIHVGKAPLYALLLLPLLRHAIRNSADGLTRAVSAGMLAGTCIVVAVILYERALYTGLFDVAKHYRTTALFWEMPVGGAALDGYLALAWPFVAGAVLRSQTTCRWAAAAFRFCRNSGVSPNGAGDRPTIKRPASRTGMLRSKLGHWDGRTVPS